MNHIKNFNTFLNEEIDFPKGYFEYQLSNFTFEVTNGGASTGTEYGYVSTVFTKDDEEHEIQFDVYQIGGGSETITFIEIENVLVAKELGIEVDKKDRIAEDDELFQIIYDAYDSNSEGEEGDYKDMTYRIDGVSPEGVIEEGWLEVLIKKDGKSEEISFDIRQDSNSDMEATFNSDEDEEKCKSLGIELDEELETEILTAYDKYTTETRQPYLD